LGWTCLLLVSLLQGLTVHAYPKHGFLRLAPLTDNSPSVYPFPGTFPCAPRYADYSKTF
jgi:hypothetical protein